MVSGLGGIDDRPLEEEVDISLTLLALDS